MTPAEDPVYDRPEETITVAQHQQIVAALELKCEALQLEVENVIYMLNETKRHFETLCKQLKATL